MNIDFSKYKLINPKNLKDALKLMAKNKDQTVIKPIAGGTDLMVLFERGILPEGEYLNILNLKELNFIKISKQEIEIGAATTFNTIKDHPIIKKEFPMLADAAKLVGAWAIQSRATIAGNIANASPAADSPPALLCYDAKLKIKSHTKTDIRPLHGFYTGYKAMNLGPAELICSIILPRPLKTTSIERYHKVGARVMMAISKVCFAGKITLKDKKIDEIRLACGSVAPYSLRLCKTEEILLKKELSKETIARAIKTLEKEIAPIQDIRSTKEYRVQVAKNILKDFLNNI